MSNSNSDADGHDIFVARQPIFDVHRHVFAYELLFRKGFQNYASKFDLEYATVKVISNSLIMGLHRLTGGKKTFIKFNRQLLLADIPRLFPTDLLAVEIQDQVDPEKNIITVCEKMRKAGYLMVLDDFTFDEIYRPLLHIVDILKVDFLVRDRSYRSSIIERVNAPKVKFLAEKIETQEQFEEARKLGYHYFQGFFFHKPDVLSSREMPGYKLNYLQILKKVCDPDLPFDDIEAILKHDISLTYKLLRFINSASYGFRVTVRSIKHALVLLGKREVKKWLTLIALSGIGSNKPPELMNNTLIRARFCELIGQELELKDQTPEFFLVGMFSMADAFLDRPMDEVLEGLPLDETLKDALLGKPGLFKNILDLVLAYERADWASAGRLADRLNLTESKLVGHYVEAVQWVRAF
jgi:EAL and modified HD-GYP domain-containing signal transduction protein